MGSTKPRKFERYPEIEQEICRLYVDDVLSCDAIAKQYGVSHLTIMRVLRAHDIKIRGRGYVTPLGRENLRRIQSGRFSRGELKIPALNDEMRLKISIANSGENNHHWNGGRTINSRGYVYVIDPEKIGKNLSGKKRYILEHRLVMERHLGRKLTSNEHVHHINGVKDDNRIENLQVVLNKMHRGMVKCPFCSAEFSVQ